jgi:hypothetical protein
VEPGVLGGATCDWGGCLVQIAEGEDAVRVEGGGVCGGGLSSLSAQYRPLRVQLCELFAVIVNFHALLDFSEALKKDFYQRETSGHAL